jgi:hypothetical protein
MYVIALINICSVSVFAMQRAPNLFNLLIAALKIGPCLQRIPNSLSTIGRIRHGQPRPTWTARPKIRHFSRGLLFDR